MKALIRILPAFIMLATVMSCESNQDTETKIKGISVHPESLELEIGEQFPLSVTVSPKNATNRKVVFESDNESVASVNEDGIVEALAAGEAIITATSEDGGHKAGCTVSVTETLDVLTGLASHISCCCAEISGKSGSDLDGCSAGVMVSTSENVKTDKSGQIPADTFDSEGNFTINTGILDPETTYYYCAYIEKKGVYAYGGVKSFKTTGLDTMISTGYVSDVRSKEATMNAVLDLTDCNYKQAEYGFEVTPKGGSTYTVKSTNHAAKQFSYTDKTLSISKEYTFTSFVTLDGKTFRGESKQFTTESLSVSVSGEISDIDYTTAMLSGKFEIKSYGTFDSSIALYYSENENSVSSLKSKGTKVELTASSDGSFTKALEDLGYVSSYRYTVIANVDGLDFDSGVKTFSTKSFPEGSVDMGLTVYWSSTNVGASNPWDLGKYFLQGGTVGQTWNGTAFSDGGALNKEYTNFEVDGYGTLLLPYDAARQNMGGRWRMPKEEEFEDLITSCEISYVKVKGINGIIAKGTTGNVIFLPAAGYGDNADIMFDNNVSGHYWSSTIITNSNKRLNKQAYLIFVNDTCNSWNAIHYNDIWDSNGNYWPKIYSVRAVQARWGRE